MWLLTCGFYIFAKPNAARNSSNEGTLLDYTMWQSEHDGGHPEV